MRRLQKLKLHKLSFTPHNDSLTKADMVQIKLLQKRNAFNECYFREAEHIRQNAARVGDFGPVKLPTLLFCSNGKQTFRNWVDNQKNFSQIMDAKLICYDCGHYLHYYKSDEMIREIKNFIKA